MKISSLCENHLFSKAYAKGKCHANRYTAVYALKNYHKTPAGAPCPTRLGLTVNRKLGNAVQRNRVKRMMREAYRAHLADIRDGYLIVIAARGAAFGPTVKMPALKRGLEESLSKLGLMAGGKESPVVPNQSAKQ